MYANALIMPLVSKPLMLSDHAPLCDGGSEYNCPFYCICLALVHFCLYFHQGAHTELPNQVFLKPDLLHVGLSSPLSSFFWGTLAIVTHCEGRISLMLSSLGSCVSKLICGYMPVICILCIIVIQTACLKSPPRAQRCVINSGCSLCVVATFLQMTHPLQSVHLPICKELETCIELKLLQQQRAASMSAVRMPWLSAAIPCPASPSHIRSLHHMQETPSTSSRTLYLHADFSFCMSPSVSLEMIPDL